MERLFLMFLDHTQRRSTVGIILEGHTVRLTATAVRLRCYNVCTNPQKEKTGSPREKTDACGRSPAEILGSNPTGAWIFVCCECRVLSGRGLCDELITRPEESYRLCCAVVCDLETSRMGVPYIYDISRLRVNHRWCLS